MNKLKIELEPIGVIHTKYRKKEDTPAQGVEVENSFGKIEMYEKYLDGIKGLKVGDNITIIFRFDKSNSFELVTNARISIKKLGVFSTRSPNRPNGLGISTIKILSIKNNMIVFSGADMFDNSPLIDIKPNLNAFYE